MASGILINKQSVAVPGVTIVGPREEPWAYLNDGNCRPRTNSAGQLIWTRQYTLHKTIADDPEKIEPGAGPADGAKRTIIDWQQKFTNTAGLGRYCGAHLVTSHDGVVVQLADLVITETFHARTVNAYAVGHETCELVGGVSFQVAMDATVATCLASTEAIGIQHQIPKLGSYTGNPIPRMVNGGPDMVGIFGHRDNDDDRGKWDPGEVFFHMLADEGCEQFDFADGEDKRVWAQRQADLNLTLKDKLARPLVCDGVPGPATVAALKLAGYRSGIYALGMA